MMGMQIKRIIVHLSNPPLREKLAHIRCSSLYNSEQLLFVAGWTVGLHYITRMVLLRISCIGAKYNRSNSACSMSCPYSLGLREPGSDIRTETTGGKMGVDLALGKII